MLLTVSTTGRAQTTQPQEEVAKNDSIIEVIAWFSKNDTIDYIIHDGEWKVAGNDTVQTSGISTKVSIIVRDSTATGYKMDYTFIDVKADSLRNAGINDLASRMALNVGKKIIGTTIKFETDEVGRITKFTNLADIKKQAKAVFKLTIKEIESLPAIQKLKKETGIDMKNLLKDVTVDDLVDEYVAEIKLLFTNHGTAFKTGEFSEHKDATDEEYENNITSEAGINPEDGSYRIYAEEENILPAEDAKALVGAIVGVIVKKELPDYVQKGLDEGIKTNMSIITREEIIYRYDGWPTSVVQQTKSLIGDRGKLKQKYIYADAYSLHNQ